MTPKEIRPTPTYPWFAKRRNIVLLILGFFLLFSATFLFLCDMHYQKVTQQTLKDDRDTAKLLSLILEEYFQRITKTMESYTNRPLLIQAAKQKNTEKVRKHLINLTRNNPDINVLVITDRKGTMWASQPDRPEISEKNFAYRDWYRGVSNKWKPYVSDATLRVMGEKDTAFHIAVPIFDETGEAIGILVNTQRTVGLNEMIKQVSLDKEADISITDRQSRIIYSSRYDYQKKLATYPFYKTAPGRQVGRNGSGTVSNLFSEDPNRYASSAPLAHIGWRAFVERDKHSILVESSAHFAQMAVIFILMFLSISLFLMYFRKHVMEKMDMDNLRGKIELLASETRFRELFDHMSSGVAVYEAVHDGEDFIILDLNEAARKITHVQEGFAGKSVRDVFAGVMELGLFQVLQQVWRTGVAASHPVSQYQDQNLVFWTENYVYKLPSGQIVAMFDDVTEQTLAEEKLRESEDKFKYIFDNSMVSKSITLPDGKVSVNKAFSKVIGYSQEEMNNRKWQDITHPDDIALTHAKMDVILSGKKESVRFMKRFIHKNGSVVWMNIGSSLRRDKDGRPLYFITSLVDITEQKQAELQREAALKEVEKLYAELEQRVIERTAELSAKTTELERLNRVFVDRELRMRELKNRIAELEGK